MKIVNLKINGISNPVGFTFKKVKVSWQVESFNDKKQEKVIIVVSSDDSFEKTIYVKSGDLNSVCEVLEMELKPRTRYYYRVAVIGINGEQGISEAAFFETGKMDEPWEAHFISTVEEDKFHPAFIKTFSAGKDIKNAKLYITGLGLYEAYLNGTKVGNDYLAPFCNDYNEAIQYQTYDVKDFISENNEIQIITGNGWYKGRFGLNGGKSEIYGDRFCTIAELVLEYEDGDIQKVVTDNSWHYCGSDIEDSGIYDGEIYNRELYKNKNNPLKPVVEVDISKDKLVERYSLPVIAKEEIKVKEIIKTPKGETVLDLGQNFAGYMEFKSKLPSGVKISLDFGEILQQGNFYNDNYGTAAKPFVYISNGEEETVRPHFTFFGFRYVRVTGWPGEIDINDFVGKAVYSDLETTGFIETSNEDLNKLALNCMWGQKSNFLDMPTDCPQRDERLGWTGDAQVFAPTASFNMDTRAFYMKFLRDLRIDQLKHNGAVASYIPSVNSFLPGGAAVWGDAATFIPDLLYVYYGDKDILEENYPLMKDWVDYLITQENNHGFQFGDWLALDGVTENSLKGSTDENFIAKVYFYASAIKLSKAAEITGKSEDADVYKEKALKIKESVLHEYFSPSGRLTIDTQTAYYISLKFGIYIDKEKVISGLKDRMKKDCYKIKGGFVGATCMCQVLADNGMADLAYHILLQEGYPGWINCINLGATTIWERWNSILPDGTINPAGMNSLNHYSYGSVMEFVYKNIAGIKPLAPGFSEALFEPIFNTKLRYVNFEYNSVSGKYVSGWKINDDGTVTVNFEVPFNCRAKVKLPDYEGDMYYLEAGRHEINYKPSTDYRKLFNMNSRLEELGKNNEAMKILSEELPMAAGMIAGGDAENLSASLNELQFMFFLGFNPEAVGKATKRLFEINAF